MYSAQRGGNHEPDRPNSADNTIVHIKRSNEHRCSYPRPEVCSKCGNKTSLIGHGYYQRKVNDAQQTSYVSIQRWLCKVCGRTMSVLPDFLLPYRRYTLGVIEAVLEDRHERKLTWTELKKKWGEKGLYSVRMMQRWCKVFGGEASRWLVLVVVKGALAG